MIVEFCYGKTKLGHSAHIMGIHILAHEKQEINLLRKRCLINLAVPQLARLNARGSTTICAPTQLLWVVTVLVTVWLASVVFRFLTLLT